MLRIRYAHIVLLPILVVSAAYGDVDPIEEQIVEHVRQRTSEAIDFLRRTVEINSGTMNHAGVRRVGELYARQLEPLGLETQWIDMREAVQRAGHLFAEIDGGSGRRVLLIGHLDTVFELDSEFQGWSQDGERVHGPGTEDMKGGNAVIVFALKALHDAGVLSTKRLIVALTGDEEMPGDPLSTSRRDLLEAGERSDIALGFEAGVRDIHTATVARRGASEWTLEVEARPAHSSQIFEQGYGAGAIFETTRILQAFYAGIRGEEYLTFNPGIILGGSTVSYDGAENRGTAFGKTNVIPEKAVVEGDLRFISALQEERTRDRMRAIVGLTLPETQATIHFRDGYPAMEPTAANYQLLDQFRQVSKDLGFGEVEALDPAERGAADVSFVASRVEASLDGLGPVGWGGHTIEEGLDITTLEIATSRAAVLIHRLTR